MSENLDAWIGRQETSADTIGTGPIAGLAATIGALPGNMVSPLAHWLHFLPYTPHDQIGEDGHPKRGGFLPPVPLPRRMWAGSDIDYRRPFRLGTPVTRTSTIGSVEHKSGRSGDLVFVRVDHAIDDADGTLLVEQQHLVYRDAPQPGQPAPAPQAAPTSPGWCRTVVPDPVLLFRYSALTFNGHRIHYDRPYATGEEGYAGLVVHGPLLATLLLHELIARHPDAAIAHYRFRAVRPVLDIAPFHICGSLGADGTADLFAADDSGALCMTATATLR